MRGFFSLGSSDLMAMGIVAEVEDGNECWDE
jgi:hypothetical protein